MTFRLGSRCAVLALLAAPALALGQFTMIQELPGQSDDDFGYTGQEIIEAANGDILVFVVKNGEPTGPCCPVVGEPAVLNLYRTTDGGRNWEDVVVLDTAIEDDGTQGLVIPSAAVLPGGDILLTYSFLNGVGANFSTSIKVWRSSDNGRNWTRLNDKDNLSYNLVVTPQGTVFSVDAEPTDEGGEIPALYRYDAANDLWNRLGELPFGPSNCGRWLHATSDTDLAFYTDTCSFGYGGTSDIARFVSTDGGQSFGTEESLFAADSGFGNWGSVVTMPDGSLRASYFSGPVIVTRDSTDGGASWSDAASWTAGTQQIQDNGARCSPSSLGALCTFLGRRGTNNQLVHVGIAGKSRDTLLGPPPFSINPGLNDAWFNPATNGQGFFVNVFEDAGIVFVAWFTYDTERPPEDVEAILGEPGHRWITAQGPFDGTTALLDITVTEGGVFDSPAPAPTGSVQGTMTLEFESCAAGTVSYRLPDLGLENEVPIQRVVQDNVALCEALADPGASN